MNVPRFSRRRFLQSTAAGTLAFPAILRSQTPGDKLRVVIIGCTGRGGANMSEMLGENIVALCDVNARNLDAASLKAPGAKKFRDFRKLYEELKESEYDAVVVS